MSDAIAGRWPSEALVVFVDRLYEAVAARNLAAVTRMLRMRIAGQLPRDVREDVLATARAPRGSFRTPIHLLQFRHRMVQLGADPGDSVASQLELELRPRALTKRRHVNSSRSTGPWKRRGQG